MRKMNFFMSAATLMAFSGLAVACPPECEDAGCTEGEEQAQSSVWFGEMSDDGDGVVQWIGDDGSIHEFLGEDDESNVEIMIFSDGKTVKVMRNGKEVPAESLKELGNRFQFLGDLDAGGILNMKVAPDAEGNFSFGTMWTSDDDESLPQVIKGEMKLQPPVMLGITMGEPDEALRSQLGLGDRQVIMIDSVIDGLPASKAGLRKYDIVVGLDGSDDDVTPAHLHKILMGKKSGDELKLRVLRGGEKETYRVELKAYNAKDLGIEDEQQFVVESEQAHSNLAEHANQMAEMVEQLRESGMSKEQIAKIQRQVEGAMAQAKKAMGDRQMIQSRGSGPMVFSPKTVVPAPDGRRMLEIEMPDLRNFQVPHALRDQIQQFGSSNADDFERRLNELESRMDEVSARMEERLDRVISRFEELTNRLERRLRDGG